MKSKSNSKWKLATRCLYGLFGLVLVFFVADVALHYTEMQKVTALYDVYAEFVHEAQAEYQQLPADLRKKLDEFYRFGVSLREVASVLDEITDAEVEILSGYITELNELAKAKFQASSLMQESVFPFTSEYSSSAGGLPLYLNSGYWQTVTQIALWTWAAPEYVAPVQELLLVLKTTATLNPFDRDKSGYWVKLDELNPQLQALWEAILLGQGKLYAETWYAAGGLHLGSQIERGIAEPVWAYFEVDGTAGEYRTALLGALVLLLLLSCVSWFRSRA